MYEDFYNLTRRPFQLTPDPYFLFRSKGHQRALSYLLYGMEQREGFVVITGKVGTGKTLLIQTLIDEIHGRDVTAAQVSMANLDADGVLPMVASAFGLAHENRNKVGLFNDLAHSVLPSYPRGALLIVDEAQTCTPAALEELRMLSNLQSDGRALLQIFLVGQSDLRTTLSAPDMEQLRQRVIASHHLQPLNAEEVIDYIRHRLIASGWKQDPKFTKKLCIQVQEWAGGIPRRINMLMDRLLLYGYLEDLHQLSIEDLQNVIEEFEAELPSGLQETALAEDAGAAGEMGNPSMARRIAALEQSVNAALGYDKAGGSQEKTGEGPAKQPTGTGLQQRLALLEEILSDPEVQARLGMEPASAETRPPGKQEQTAAERPAWGRFAGGLRDAD